MTRSAAVRALTCVSVALATMQCTDSTAPRMRDDSLGVILSGLVPPGSGGPAAASSPVVTARVVYVSLPPQAVPAGITATITNRATGANVSAAVVNGGFDPVPIGANIGDTLAVAITTTEAGASLNGFVLVAARRAPKVVRTNPPPGGRDVPLNRTIVVVFSEPLDPGTLDTASLRLERGNAPVAGTVRLAAGSNLIAEFQPASLLSPQTSYVFTVSPEIHGVAGLAVTAPDPVSFRTGTSVQAAGATQLAFTVQPTNGTVGRILSPFVVAIQDSSGNTVTSANDVVTLMSSCVQGGDCDSAATSYSLSGYLAVQAVNGVATFSSVDLWIAATGYTLVATSGTLAPATSAPFDIGPGTPAYLRLGAVQNTTVAQPLSVDVTIMDPRANRVSTASDTVTLSLASGPAGATLAGTLTVAAVNGVAHFTGVSVDQPGVYRLAAAATSLTSATQSFVSYAGGILVSVTAGGTHSCALNVSGVAFCWGLNDHGQLGDSTTTNRTMPVAVAGGLTFTVVSTGGGSTCGVTATGDAYCWGLNDHGQLGDGTTVDRTSPVLVVGGLHFLEVSAGTGHTCGLVSNSITFTEPLTYCWGRNDHGQLGDGTTNQRTSPTLLAVVEGYDVPPLQNDIVSTGGSHTCGLNYDLGFSVCWGDNSTGQLGDRTTTDRPTPVFICGPPHFDCDGYLTVFNPIITSGSGHTCASYYLQSIVWYCWGANTSGQLGDGTTTDRMTPVLVGSGRSFFMASAGGSHTCGVAGQLGPSPSGSGDAYCWGSNSNGQLGDGTLTQRTSPVLVTGGLSFLSVSAGATHTCGVTVTGVYCWGSNAAGELGNGGTTDSNVPVKVLSQ